MIQVSQNGQQLVFEEKARKKLCFLSAKIINSELIANVNEDEEIIFNNKKIKMIQES